MDDIDPSEILKKYKVKKISDIIKDNLGEEWVSDAVEYVKNSVETGKEDKLSAALKKLNKIKSLTEFKVKEFFGYDLPINGRLFMAEYYDQIADDDELLNLISNNTEIFDDDVFKGDNYTDIRNKIMETIGDNLETITLSSIETLPLSQLSQSARTSPRQSIKSVRTPDIDILTKTNSVSLSPKIDILTATTSGRKSSPKRTSSRSSSPKRTSTSTRSEIPKTIHVKNSRLDTSKYRKTLLNNIFNDSSCVLLLDIKKCQKEIYPICIYLYQSSTINEVFDLVVKSLLEAEMLNLGCDVKIRTGLQKYKINSLNREHSRYIYMELSF
jgi:hypothetical protein